MGLDRKRSACCLGLKARKGEMFRAKVLADLAAKAARGPHRQQDPCVCTASAGAGWAQSARPSDHQVIFCYMTDAVASAVCDRFLNRFAQSGRAVGNNDACGFHCFDLVICAALAASDNRARVAHAAARRRRAACDEASDRLPTAFFLLLGDEFRRLFFGRATDLTDHDDGLGLRIV